MSHTLRSEVDPLCWAELVGHVGGAWGEVIAGARGTGRVVTRYSCSCSEAGLAPGWTDVPASCEDFARVVIQNGSPVRARAFSLGVDKRDLSSPGWISSEKISYRMPVPLAEAGVEDRELECKARPGVLDLVDRPRRSGSWPRAGCFRSVDESAAWAIVGKDSSASEFSRRIAVMHPAGRSRAFQRELRGMRAGSLSTVRLSFSLGGHFSEQRRRGD